MLKTTDREQTGTARVSSEQSVLSQLKDPRNLPLLTALGEAYTRVRLYRDWHFGRQAKIRHPQKADLPSDYLEPDSSNLGLILSRIAGVPQQKHAILKNLRELYEGIDDYHVGVHSGYVEISLLESGVRIPASRLSDGTLRYLCLLTILCDPDPPPLVCIEEPELGLHPDIIPVIARLLIEAASRMQLIVTTHSDILVDELSEQPESVVVCEKENGQTQMKRLDAKELKVWLDKYSLGRLWTKGQIGGTRY